jgi:hypothetical protein
VAPKTPESYVLRLGDELRTLERSIATRLRLALLEAFAHLRLILQRLPDDGLARRLLYQQLRPALEEALVPLNDALAATLSLEVWAFQRRARTLAAQWLGAADLPDEAPTALLRSIRFLAHTLATYFERHSPSQFMREILRLVDRTVERGILDGTPTAQLLQQVLPETTRRGQRLYVIRRGTIANAVRARIDAIISAALWQTYSTQAERVWTSDPQPPNAPVLWEWSAVLDPRTCPICAPLDGQRRLRPTDFPVLPQVHPNCRCVVLPVIPS